MITGPEVRPMETLVGVVPNVALTLQELGEAFDSQSGFSKHVDGHVLRLDQGDSSAWLIYVPPEDYEANAIFEDWPEGLMPAGRSTVWSVDYRDPVMAVRIVRAIDARHPVLVATSTEWVGAGRDITEEILRQTL